MAPDLPKLLEQLIQSKVRSTAILKEPDALANDGWFFYMCPAHNNALDLKLTSRTEKGLKNMEWTQGSSFSFKEGDAIYDTPKAYQEWGEALKHIKLCVQVESAIPAEPTTGTKGRSQGFIKFKVLTPNNGKSAVIARGSFSMTQDEFLLFLISGPSEEIKSAVHKAKDKD